MRWCDADLDGGTIYIDRPLQQHDGQIIQAPPKTNSSRRAVALDTTTASVLRRHRALQRAEARALRREPLDYVFSNEHGDPVTPDYLTRRFAELLATTDLPPIRLHERCQARGRGGSGSGDWTSGRGGVGCGCSGGSGWTRGCGCRSGWTSRCAGRRLRSIGRRHFIPDSGDTN